jgi:hypothetical protein
MNEPSEWARSLFFPAELSFNREPMPKSRKRKTKGRRRGPKENHNLEPYQFPFATFHQQLAEEHFDPSVEHPTREQYWSKISAGRYRDVEADQLLAAYIQSVELALESDIQIHSVAYWIYAYRRIAPGAIRQGMTAVTRAWIRTTVEAAFRKFGRLDDCGGLKFSHQVDLATIFSGFYSDEKFRNYREALTKAEPHLLLVEFGLPEIKKIYEFERLAFEVWKSMAARRIVGKGADLIVLQTSPWFVDDRTPELNRLVVSYDSRSQRANVSATGTIFDPSFGKFPTMLATYNYDNQPASSYAKLFRQLKVKVRIGRLESTNFIWTRFGIDQYWRSHEPFFAAFESKHGVQVEYVLAVLIFFCFLEADLWQTNPAAFISAWQRGYRATLEPNDLKLKLHAELPVIMRHFNANFDRVDSQQVDRALSMLLLDNRKKSLIDVGLGHLHTPIIPIVQDRWMIDHAWIAEFLYSLFFQIKLSDENFKGDYLEKFISRNKSPLSSARLNGRDDTSRQVDASFQIGSVLVIVECKAFARSVGIQRGQRQAIRYRIERISKRGGL